jgi:hypothetical protein
VRGFLCVRYTTNLLRLNCNERIISIPCAYPVSEHWAAARPTVIIEADPVFNPFVSDGNGVIGIGARTTCQSHMAGSCQFVDISVPLVHCFPRKDAFHRRKTMSVPAATKFFRSSLPPLSIPSGPTE